MSKSENILITQQTLLLKVKNQYDEEAWEQFVDYYRKYIYAVLINMGVPNTDLDDLSQQIMLKLWKKLPGFDYDPQVGSFRSWLCTIVRNRSCRRYSSAANSCFT